MQEEIKLSARVVKLPSAQDWRGTKADLAELVYTGCTMDYALPQQWLNNAEKLIPGCYEDLRFGSVVIYDQDQYRYGAITPITSEAEYIMKKLKKFD